MKTKYRIKIGIAAYGYELDVIRRILRRYGPISGARFNRIFSGYKGDRQRRPAPVVAFSGYTYVMPMLGDHIQQKYLFLTKRLVELGEVVFSVQDGEAFYGLPS